MAPAGSDTIHQSADPEPDAAGRSWAGAKGFAGWLAGWLAADRCSRPTGSGGSARTSRPVTQSEGAGEVPLPRALIPNRFEPGRLVRSTERNRTEANGTEPGADPLSAALSPPEPRAGAIELRNRVRQVEQKMDAPFFTRPELGAFSAGLDRPPLAGPSASKALSLFLLATERSSDK